MQKISEIVFPEFNLSLDLITYKSSQIKDIKQIDKSYPRIHSIIKTDLDKFGAFDYSCKGVIALNMDSSCNKEWALLTFLYYWLNSFNLHMNLNSSASEIGARIIGYCVEVFLPQLRKITTQNQGYIYNDLPAINSIFSSIHYNVNLELLYYDPDDSLFGKLLERVTNEIGIVPTNIKEAEGFSIPATENNSGIIGINIKSTRLRESIITHELYHWIMSYKSIYTVTLSEEAIIFGRAIKTFFQR